MCLVTSGSWIYSSHPVCVGLIGSDLLRQTIWKSRGSLYYSFQCCAHGATELVSHTDSLQSLETSPNVLSWINLLLPFTSRLYSLTGKHPQHLASFKATIHKVEKNASKPAWLVVVKGLQGSSAPRVSLGFHMCVCCCITMPLVSAWTGLSL